MKSDNSTGKKPLNSLKKQGCFSLFFYFYSLIVITDQNMPGITIFNTFVSA